MSESDNKQVVLEFFENFSKGNGPAVLDAMADDATWWVMGNFPMSGTQTKQQFAERLPLIASVMPQGVQIKPTGVTAEGNRVAVEGEATGTHANGKQYNNRCHYLIEVRDGKISAIREYFDTMHANDVFCT